MSALIQLLGASHDPAGGGGGRITFTDNFTGVDNDPPNARWTQDTAGWRILSNKLNFNGGAHGYLWTNCTTGDNDFTLDCSAIGLDGYFVMALRWIDASNSTGLYIDPANGHKFTFITNTAGVVVPEAVETVATPTISVILRLRTIGNLFSLFVDGSPHPELTNISIATHTGANKIAIALNTGQAGTDFDNAVLA